MNKWVLGLLVLAFVAGSAVLACPPPAAPEYDGPGVGDGPAPPDKDHDKDKDKDHYTPGWGYGDVHHVHDKDIIPGKMK